MLKYLTDLLAGPDAFTLDIVLEVSGANVLAQCALVAVDATGLVIEQDSTTEHSQLVPWTSVRRVLVTF